MKYKFIKITTLLLFISFLTTIAVAKSINDWPYQTKNLKPDPSIKFGKLDNGLRYVLKYNKKPEKRVSIMLDVQVGSINEKDNERGIAHYLEHMLFNGSKHFKPDELVKFFQRIGMTFGPDVNAHTGFNETVYKILLPNNEEKLLEEGLLVMRDYADGALLLESETQKEKGVILAEKMTRDSADFRALMAELAFLYKGSNIEKRFPIGTDKTIKAVDSKLLKQFYNKWYNADNMVLVIVGDIDINQTEKLIKKQFSSMEKKQTPKNEVYIGKVNHTKDSAFYYYEKNAGKTTVGIWKVMNIPNENDSIEKRKDDLIKYILNIAFYFRIQDELAKENCVFTDAQFMTHDFLDRYGSIGIQADTKSKNWEKSLAKIEKIIRQAVIYGFSEQEIQLAKNAIKANLKENTLTSTTRKSTSISSELIDDINSKIVSLSPQQKEELYNKLMNEITYKDVNTKLKTLWNDKPALISVSGNLKLKGDKKEINDKLLNIYQTSNKEKVSPPEIKESIKFPYLKPNNKISKIVNEKEYKTIGVKSIEFENNIRINLKKTNFDKGKIYITINFGKGEFDEPENKPALADVSQSIIDESGLGKISSEELTKMMSGKITSMDFSIGENSFKITGSTTQSEKELFFQLAYHLLNDPGYRKNIYDNYMKRTKLSYAKKAHNIQSVYGLEIMRFLSSGNHKLSQPTLNEILDVKLSDIKNWTKPIFEKSALEINIVGDFKEKEILTIVEKYFASLPKRKKNPPFIYTESVKFPYGKTLVKEVDTKINKAIVNVIYPTIDKENIHEVRKLVLLASLIEEKMRVEIREKLGETYSPFAHNFSSEVFKDFGFLRTMIFISPDKTDQIVQIVKNISNDIIKNGITEDEMIRIKKPLLTEIKVQVKSNSYWLHSVLSNSEFNPDKLKWAETITKDYESISKKDLHEAAKKYLKNDKAAVIIIKPAK
jgi:zinc protease